eukprot:9500211-Pyramimonas_sp.AAC.1
MAPQSQQPRPRTPRASENKMATASPFSQRSEQAQPARAAVVWAETYPPSAQLLPAPGHDPLRELADHPARRARIQPGRR